MPLAEIETAIGQILQNDVLDQVRGGLESLNRMELTRVEHIAII